MRNSIIVPLLLVLASVGLFFGVIDPAYSKVQTLEERNQQLEEALVKAEEFSDALVDLRSRYNLVPDEDKKRLLKFLPDHVDNVRLIINVADIAEQHEVSVQNFEISGEEQANKKNTSSTAQRGTAVADVQASRLYEEIELSFAAYGTYDDFLAFLDDLERNLRVVDTVHVSVTPPGADVDHATAPYLFDLTLKTYWLK